MTLRTVQRYQTKAVAFKFGDVEHFTFSGGENPFIVKCDQLLEEERTIINGEIVGGSLFIAPYDIIKNSSLYHCMAGYGNKGLVKGVYTVGSRFSYPKFEFIVYASDEQEQKIFRGYPAAAMVVENSSYFQISFEPGSSGNAVYELAVPEKFDNTNIQKQLENFDFASWGVL